MTQVFSILWCVYHFQVLAINKYSRHLIIRISIHRLRCCWLIRTLLALVEFYWIIRNLVDIECHTVTAISVLANNPKFTVSSYISQIFLFQATTNARKLELLQPRFWMVSCITHKRTKTAGTEQVRPETLECLLVEIFFSCSYSNFASVEVLQSPYT